MSNGHKTNIRRNNVSKIESNPHYIPHINTPPISYTNPPSMSMTTLISKLLLIFVTSDKWQINQVDISSSLGKPSSSSSSASSLLEPTSLSSLDAGGDGEKAIVKPPMTACRCAIRLTRVYTWHNSSLRVSRWASMHTSCAMMALIVTPLVEDGGVEVDGAVEAGGAVVFVRGRLERSYSTLCLMVAASMAHMNVKWGDSG